MGEWEDLEGGQWDFSGDEPIDLDETDLEVDDILRDAAAKILGKLTRKTVVDRAHLVVTFISEGGIPYTETFSTGQISLSVAFGDLFLEAKRIERRYADDD